MISGFDKALMEALHARPGRGGVRLQYKQADRLLRLLAAASTAALENRQLRGRIAALQEQVARVEDARNAALGALYDAEERLREERAK